MVGRAVQPCTDDISMKIKKIQEQISHIADNVIFLLFYKNMENSAGSTHCVFGKENVVLMSHQFITMDNGGRWRAVTQQLTAWASGGNKYVVIKTAHTQL